MIKTRIYGGYIMKNYICTLLAAMMLITTSMNVHADPTSVVASTALNLPQTTEWLGVALLTCILGTVAYCCYNLGPREFFSRAGATAAAASAWFGLNHLAKENTLSRMMLHAEVNFLPEGWPIAITPLAVTGALVTGLVGWIGLQGLLVNKTSTNSNQPDRSGWVYVG
jgi:hypothetical protein